jgi:hypothetical protein
VGLLAGVEEHRRRRWRAKRPAPWGRATHKSATGEWLGGDRCGAQARDDGERWLLGEEVSDEVRGSNQDDPIERVKRLVYCAGDWRTKG